LTDADFTGAEVRGVNLNFSQITTAQLYSTASYKAHDLTGIALYGDLTGWNFAGQNLTDANFSGATLSGADFTGAEVRGANFYKYSYLPSGTGVTVAQLYSTVSYRAHNLSRINLSGNDLSSGDFAGQNLTNAYFTLANLTGAEFSKANLTNAQFDSATLTGADFSGADTRGAQYLDLSGATTTNLIRPNGQIDGLDLNAGGLLVVRDYDGNSYSFPPTGPIPITVDQHLTMGPNGTMRMEFEADAWDSTISFAPGIPVTLGGTLELTFAGDVNLASQVGRTFELFDWTGVDPTGLFAVASPHIWDLSQLYTTGEVKLAAVGPLPGDYNGDGIVDAADYIVWSANLGGATLLNRSPHLAGPVGPADYAFWKAHFGNTLAVTGSAGAALSAAYPAAIPEPTTLGLAALGLIGLVVYFRRPAPKDNANSNSDEESLAKAQRRRVVGIGRSTPRPQRLCVSLLSIVVFAGSTCADIYQWEYIDPADPGQGKQKSTTLAPDGAGATAGRGANIAVRNLTKAYLIGADLSCFSWGGFGCRLVADLAGTNLSQSDLTDARLDGATLTDADFTNAEVRGVKFGRSWYSGDVYRGTAESRLGSSTPRQLLGRSKLRRSDPYECEVPQDHPDGR
jgi:uncharacterized protein YjbI with pentapeptide repeats